MEAVSRGREAGPWLPVPAQWDCHVGSHMGNEAPERGTKISTTEDPGAMQDFRLMIVIFWQK